MSIEANKGLVLGLFENLSAGKIEAVLDAMTDTATWWVAGNFELSGTKTKAEFGELLKGVTAAMPNGLKITPKVVIAEGDRVSVEATSYAELANGKVYNNQYHFMIEVSDGKVQAVREYLDTIHAKEILVG